MRCSWSERIRNVLTPRLVTALAASAALHALLVGGLVARGGQATARASAALSAILVSEAAAEERPAAAPAARPTLRTGPLLKRYYRRSELDVAPNIMTHVVPEYPHMAHTSGKVTIRLFIDERGTVEHVAVLRADPPGHFEASAQRAFLAARFTPGMKRGVAVKSQLTLQVDYTQPR